MVFNFYKDPNPKHPKLYILEMPEQEDIFIAAEADVFRNLQQQIQAVLNTHSLN